MTGVQATGAGGRVASRKYIWVSPVTAESSNECLQSACTRSAERISRPCRPCFSCRQIDQCRTQREALQSLFVGPRRLQVVVRFRTSIRSMQHANTNSVEPTAMAARSPVAVSKFSVPSTELCRAQIQALQSAKPSSAEHAAGAARAFIYALQHA